MGFRLLTFGGLTGSRDGVPQDWVQTHSLRVALLVHVAVERHAARGAIGHLLWPEANGRSASHRLNQSLYELRRMLGEDCIETRGRSVDAGPVLTTDAGDFENAIAERRYEAAVELYRGAFLGGVHLVNTSEFELWVDARRARYGRMFRQACRGVLSDLLTAGDLAGASAVAERWVAADPFDDEAQHRLIELLAATGRSTDAVDRYAGYEAALESTGLQPLEETRRLVAILEGQAKTAGGRAGGLLTPLKQGGDTAIRRPVQEARWSRLGADVDVGLEDDLDPRYQILRQIGFGSMAQVYLVRDTTLQRLAAVKVLRPELANDPVSRIRFEREARAAARLAHPNIVTVYEVSALPNGTPYLVWEFIEGRNLADTLVAEGPLSVGETVSLLTQVASALAHAHSRQIVHRDVRPSNVVWSRDTDRAVLMDFGIVAALPSGSQVQPRITAAGETLGEPPFVSPEQLRGDPVTGAADIYSLGVLGYYLLTGRGSRGPDSWAEPTAGTAHRAPEPLSTVRPEVGPELAGLLRSCLAPQPEHRPGAREVLRRLEGMRADGRTPPQAAGRSDTAAVWWGFIDELKRRNVYKAAIIYLTTAFVILQGGQLILPSLRMSGWFDVLVAMLLGGFPVALVLAWLFDLTRAGVSRTRTPRSAAARAQQRAFQILVLTVSLVMAGLIGWYVLSG